MIWHDGQIMPAQELRIDLDDRVFEHGLGLFETLRTYDCHAPLLDLHLARLRSSADEVGLTLDFVALPNDAAISALLSASQLDGDALLRITMTGGTPGGTPPRLWMIARPLPPAEPRPRKVVVHGLAVSWSDTLGAHKSLNYWSRRKAHEWATSVAAIDCFLCGTDGELWEASRNNVVFIAKNSPRVLTTPALVGPVVPGIMRRVALDFATKLGYQVEERLVFLNEMQKAKAIFLTNSVRGVRRVEQLEHQPLDLEPFADLAHHFEHDLPRTLCRNHKNISKS